MLNDNNNNNELRLFFLYLYNCIFTLSIFKDNEEKNLTFDEITFYRIVQIKKK